MTETTVFSPKRLSEAYEILSEKGAGVKVLAGGTDLMVLYNSGLPVPGAMLNIWWLDELREITDEGEQLRLGALCSYTQLVINSLVRSYAPTLVDAARTIGAIQIQN